MYDLFKTERRLQGPKSIWDHMKLRKLQTFSSTKKSVKVKLQEKVVTLREERLMTRFVLTSRSRPEIDLPKYLGKHEFSVVPRSMFSSAGQLNLGSDKSSITHKIEDLIEKSTTGEKIDTLIERLESFVLYLMEWLLLTELSWVQPLKIVAISLHILTYNSRRRKGTDEIRIAFDRYVRDLLKLSTRQKRNTSTTIRYEVSDSTSLVNSTMKKLLSQSKT